MSREIRRSHSAVPGCQGRELFYRYRQPVVSAQHLGDSERDYCVRDESKGVDLERHQSRVPRLIKSHDRGKQQMDSYL